MNGCSKVHASLKDCPGILSIAGNKRMGILYSLFSPSGEMSYADIETL